MPPLRMHTRPSVHHRFAGVRACEGGRESALLDDRMPVTSPADAAALDPGNGPDGEYSGVVILALCCAIAAVCALDRVVLSIAILPMAAEYGFSDSTKGLVAAAFSLGYCAGLLPAGVLSAISSPKTVLAGGLVLWSAAQAATPAAAEWCLPALLAARATMGIGEAAAIPCLQVQPGPMASAAIGLPQSAPNEPRPPVPTQQIPSRPPGDRRKLRAAAVALALLGYPHRIAFFRHHQRVHPLAPNHRRLWLACDLPAVRRCRHAPPCEMHRANDRHLDDRPNPSPLPLRLSACTSSPHS